jgi:hypothetical protein
MAITGGIGNITWIDHHKTAIEKYKDFPVPIKGFRQDDVAACMLTWAYFEFKWDRPIDINIGIPTIGDHVIQLSPQFTQYIHLWDTWQWKSDIHANKIEAFITGLQGKDLHPCSDIWGELNDDEILAPECNDIPEGDLLLGSIIDKGCNMIAFRDGYAKSCCDGLGKVIEFEGYRCFACNVPKCNSEWFKSIDSSTYDILMPFYYNIQTGKFTISLYSDIVDVSKIAVKYGGGGHVSSSGFQSKGLPF